MPVVSGFALLICQFCIKTQLFFLAVSFRVNLLIDFRCPRDFGFRLKGSLWNFYEKQTYLVRLVIGENLPFRIG